MNGPELTPEDVREILRLIDESGCELFELETPRFSIRVDRRAEARDSLTRSREAAPPAAGTARDSLTQAASAPPDGLVDVTAPMVGTFYRAPAPDAPPFVEVGAVVEAHTQVCIIEVMKLMHSVAAGARGTVAEVCRENGAPVQYGDVLFRVQPESSRDAPAKPAHPSSSGSAESTPA